MITPTFTYEAWQGLSRYRFEVMEHRVQIGLRRANRALKKRGLEPFAKTTSDHRPKPGDEIYCFSSVAFGDINPDNPEADCYHIGCDAIAGHWEAWGWHNGEYWQVSGKVHRYEAVNAHKKAQEQK